MHKLYPHGERDEPPYSFPSKGCLTSPTFHLVWLRVLTNGSEEYQGDDSKSCPLAYLKDTNVTPLHLHRVAPGAHVASKPVTTKLLGLPTPSPACGLYGWLLRLTIPMNGP